MIQENVERFFYWINERHRIYLKKESGEPWPWTEDKILQTYKFTNPFRENDRDTKWMRRYWTNPQRNAPLGDQLFNVCVFRMFGSTDFLNHIGPFTEKHPWDPEWVKAQARHWINNGKKVFTGAYIITNQGMTLPKEQVVVDYFLTPIWRDRNILAAKIAAENTLQDAHELFGKYQGWGGGGFMAYEVVTDFNYTPILPNPTDRYTWANAGPGAKRGLNWIMGREPDDGRRRDWNREMWELLELSPKYLGPHIMKEPTTFTMVDMRMIEHSLCEMWKYMKVVYGLGTPRSLYKAPK
jgi:hypothetical protein